MKEENSTFCDLSKKEKKGVVANGTFGPEKMARFVCEVAERTIRRILDKGSTTDTEREQQQSSSSAGDPQTPSPNDEAPADRLEPHAAESESAPVPDEITQSTDKQRHAPNPEKTCSISGIDSTPFYVSTCTMTKRSS